MKTPVLFMQSQTYFGADSQIQALLMRHLDRSAFEVHAAVNHGSPERPSASLAAISKLPNVHLRRVHFGTSTHSRPPMEVLRSVFRDSVPALASLANLVQYARRNRIRIVHGTEKPRDAYYGLLLSRAIGAKCVIHLHVKADTWMSPLTRWAMHHADAVVGVSAFTARSAINLGYDPAHVSYVLNAMDFDGWDPDMDGGPLRDELKIPRSAVVMSIIARVFPAKGHTRLLQALALARSSLPDFRLLIVGEDERRATPGNASHCAELKALAERLDLTDQVVFTGFRSDVANVLAASDVFAMPSFEEPFGMVYLEAMAMRRPIVALESGGVPEFVEHGVTGLLSPPGDIAALANNLRTLLQDESLRRKMGAAGRSRIDQGLFSGHRMARDISRLYETLLGKSKRTTATQAAPHAW